MSYKILLFQWSGGNMCLRNYEPITKHHPCPPLISSCPRLNNSSFLNTSLKVCLSSIIPTAVLFQHNLASNRIWEHCPLLCNGVWREDYFWLPRTAMIPEHSQLYVASRMHHSSWNFIINPWYKLQPPNIWESHLVPTALGNRPNDPFILQQNELSKNGTGCLRA